MTNIKKTLKRKGDLTWEKSLQILKSVRCGREIHVDGLKLRVKINDAYFLTSVKFIDSMVNEMTLLRDSMVHNMAACEAISLRTLTLTNVEVLS